MHRAAHYLVDCALPRFIPKNCCCFAQLSSCHRRASDANYWMISTFFLAITTSGLEEPTPAEEFPMIQCSCGFLRTCPLNLLLVRSYHAEIIIVKRHIQGCNNVTRVRFEPRSCDQGYCKNVFTF